MQSYSRNEWPGTDMSHLLAIGLLVWPQATDSSKDISQSLTTYCRTP